jgi:hypothetical protein
LRSEYEETKRSQEAKRNRKMSQTEILPGLWKGLPEESDFGDVNKQLVQEQMQTISINHCLQKDVESFHNLVQRGRQC